MKQTNNAIKFLMAQYRAIFKNANLKMILAATAAAAALSVGSANADAGDGKWDSADFGKANDATNAAETIKSSQDFDASTLPNSEWNYASGESIVTGANTVLNITGAALKHFALEGLTVKEGATLKLTNTDKTNTQIFGYAKGEAPAGNKGTLKVDNGSIELTKGSMLFNTVNITAESELTISGLVGYNKDAAPTKLNDWAYFANVYAVANSGTDAGNGVLTIEIQLLTLTISLTSVAALQLSLMAQLLTSLVSGMRKATQPHLYVQQRMTQVPLFSQTTPSSTLLQVMAVRMQRTSTLKAQLLPLLTVRSL